MLFCAAVLFQTLVATSVPPTLWPVPKEPTVFNGHEVLLSPKFRITATGPGAASAVVVDGIARYEEMIRSTFPANPCPPTSYCQYDESAPCPKTGVCHNHITISCSCNDLGEDDQNACSTCDAVKLAAFTIDVKTASDVLGADTDVSYSLSIGAGEVKALASPHTGDVLAHATAATSFGALYALETFSQLLSDLDGTMRPALAHSEVYIGKDEPEYAHRALTLDVARRFVPLEALRNIVRGMAFSKLSVLHLHFSDEPAMRLEVKAFPEITAGLPDAQFYTQEEMKEFVRFAHARGVRVVPELDVPAHAGGLAALGVSGAATFCDSPFNTTLAPSADSLAAITTIFNELAALFPDELVHVGGDEACKDGCPGTCTYAGVHAVEAHAQSVLVNLGRIPMGWNEIYSSPAGGEPNAAKQPLILQNWRKGSMSTAMSGGFHSVDSNFVTMYLAQQCCRIDPPTGTSDRFSACFHVDVAAEAKDAAERKLVLGGEVAMWGDQYCPSPHCKINGTWGWMYGAEHDAIFIESYSNLVFPNAAAAAGAAWNYAGGGLPTNLGALNTSISLHNARLIERGVQSCPNGCVCDWDGSCGTPYGGRAQRTPANMRVTLTNNCGFTVKVNERFPCDRANGEALMQHLEDGASYEVVASDFIVVASKPTAAAGDPFSLWVGDATWLDLVYELKLTVDSSDLSYIVYTEVQDHK